MSFCQNCGAPLPQDANVCPNCGSSLSRTKHSSGGRVVLIVLLSVLLLCLGGGGFLMYRYVNTTEYKLSKISSLMDDRKWDAAGEACEKILSSIDGLDREQTRRLVAFYVRLADEGGNSFASDLEELALRIYHSGNSSDIGIIEDLAPSYLLKAKLKDASTKYGKGDREDAINLALEVYNLHYDLDRRGMRDLAALMSRILSDGYDAALSDAVYRLNYELTSGQSSGHSSSGRGNTSRSDASGRTHPLYVIVTGTDVRVRVGPGLEYDPISDGYGYNIHPDKGAVLECTGDASGFYNVNFAGYNCWISKDFTRPYDN